jgi:hypothetical protein
VHDGAGDGEAGGAEADLADTETAEGEAGEAAGVEEGGEDDGGGAVLVVVEDGDVDLSWMRARCRSTWEAMS